MTTIRAAVPKRAVAVAVAVSHAGTQRRGQEAHLHPYGSHDPVTSCVAATKNACFCLVSASANARMEKDPPRSSCCFFVSVRRRPLTARMKILVFGQGKDKLFIQAYCPNGRLRPGRQPNSPEFSFSRRGPKAHTKRRCYCSCQDDDEKDICTATRSLNTSRSICSTPSPTSALGRPRC
uniref:Uncharacterized protein n=1 Tax=Oryza punctata TaxID=4537 RepID=A0A0E0JWB6_ORYPU